MAYEAKANFLSMMEKRIGAELTMEASGKVMKITAEVLDGFDMTENAAEEEIRKDDLLEMYIAALKVEGRSQKTVDRYRYIIERMKKDAGVPTRKITVYHLRAWIASEKERGICDQTLEGYREIFSAYFNWLQRESMIDRNPAANLGAIKCEKKTKKIYSAVDLEKLREKCRNSRDRAIVTFLGATGCRISEATGLNRSSVDLKNLECIVHGKGKKDRMVYLDPVAGMFLQQYLDERHDSEEALFIGKGGKRLQPGGVRAMLKELGARAEVDHVHPHKFRRTLATNLSKHGMPIQEVASVLGHEKLDTTMKYVVLDNENTKNSYKRFR